MEKDLIKILIENRKKVVKKSEIPVRDECYLKAENKYKDLSVKERRAIGFAETLKEKSILIQKEDLLAGFLYQYTYNVGFPMIVSETFDPSMRASFKMDVWREVKEYESNFKIEKGSNEDNQLCWFAESVTSGIFKHWHAGHAIPHYEKILKKGFSGILKEIEMEMKKCISIHEKQTLSAFYIILDACIGYLKRYEILSEKMKNESNDKDVKERMGKIENALHNLQVQAPKTFFEAIQLVWLVHEMMYCENVPSAISFGRFDMYLYPFYKRDIEKGQITRLEVEKYLQAFFVKCSSQRKAYQNMTLGGCDCNGKCAVNDLTYLCLKVAGEMRFDQPSITFRWSEDQSEDVWNAIIKLMKTGMGFPAIMYDPVCIKARRDSEIAEEDRNDYGIIGCVELASPGKEHAMTEQIRLNLPKLLNELLDERELSLYKRFEELYLDYKQKIIYYIQKSIEVIECFEKLYEKCYPLPYLSVLTDDCIANHKDIMEGGARYQSIGFNLGGVATVADSLLALKQIVFEKGDCSLQQYYTILKDNFSGEELLQRRAQKCSKFGNDEQEVDYLAKEILDSIKNELKKYKTHHGGIYRMGLYTVEDHSIMGEKTGATADGRKAGISLSNSLGASQGYDIKGPTALINSVCRLPISQALNGMVLDIKFIPSFLAEETGRRALKKLIEIYFKKGGMEIQVSVIDKETLIAAQKEPEKYENLIVRVSGFSAYFTSLRKVTQDELIARTEYGY